jgi:putative Ca2+/H+ antiporter (TMEM165/GDT1 family)
MYLKLSLTVFAAVFVAELGDKTQIATILFASGKETSKLTIFIAASLALILTSAIAVTAGGLLSHYINERLLRIIAGIGFIAIGIFTLLKA